MSNNSRMIFFSLTTLLGAGLMLVLTPNANQAQHESMQACSQLDPHCSHMNHNRSNESMQAMCQPSQSNCAPMGHNHSMSMDLGPADASYDLRFIDGMILHHQGAVEMATEALNKSTRPEIKQLAENIIAAQNQEIKEMKDWRQAWYPQADDTPMAYDSNSKQMAPMSQQQRDSMMMNVDLGAADQEFDLRFINAMIPHHEGAVFMAQDALSKSQRTEIKQLAKNIIASQSQEIDQMKAWRQAWYQK